jgi:FtsH-binding integral membrane protein
MGLYSLVLGLLVNVILGSHLFDYVLCCFTVILFTILAAYDTQVIRAKAYGSATFLDALDCALEIYLDFLNIFLAILRLFGEKKDD